MIKIKEMKRSAAHGNPLPKDFYRLLLVAYRTRNGEWVQTSAHDLDGPFHRLEGRVLTTRNIPVGATMLLVYEDVTAVALVIEDALWPKSIRAMKMLEEAIYEDLKREKGR